MVRAQGVDHCCDLPHSVIIIGTVCVSRAKKKRSVLVSIVLSAPLPLSLRTFACNGDGTTATPF